MPSLARPRPFDQIKSAQDRLARFGLKIHCGILDAYRSVKVQLGQPGRDEKIEQFQTFLRDLGRLGIFCSKIDFHPGNTYTTAMIDSPRGYKVREFSVDDFHKKVEKQRFERVYTADDMWENYAYFIKAVLPVAEKADVRLALHPDDPPIPMMNGVAKLFIHYDAIKKAEQEIAGGSKYWGLTLCVGTWSEGGDKMGKDVFGMIQDFGSRGKIFAVHFRNVSSPLPRFHETFQDDGYLDMYEVMKAFRKVRLHCVTDSGSLPDTRRRQRPPHRRHVQLGVHARAAQASQSGSGLVQVKSIRKIQPLVGLSIFGQPGWMPASQLISAPSCIASPCGSQEPGTKSDQSPAPCRSRHRT